MADIFKALIDTELNLEKVEMQLQDLNDTKVLDVQLKNKNNKQFASDIQKGLEKTKIDTSAVTKSLADSFG